MSILPTAGDLWSLASNMLEGGVLGGLARLATQVLKLFTDKADRDHEYRMTQLAAQGRLDEIGARREASVDQGWLMALIEGIKGQSNLPTDSWAGRLSAAVRPIVTLWLLALYTACKLAIAIGLLSGGVDLPSTIAAAWTPTDATVFGSVLAFWFLDRHLRQQGR